MIFQKKSSVLMQGLTNYGSHAKSGPELLTFVNKVLLKPNYALPPLAYGLTKLCPASISIWSMSIFIRYKADS